MFPLVRTSNHRLMWNQILDVAKVIGSCLASRDSKTTTPRKASVATK